MKDRGTNLSGGQRQLVEIARALVRKPKILILDEATSHLDALNELAICKTLEELMADRTTIVIAHRLSTIRNADKIAVIKNGKIIEIGNHEELLEKGGEYTQLISNQLSFR